MIRMKDLLPICLFLVFLSCSGTKEDKNTETTDNITEDDVYTMTFDSLTGSELEKLFTIDVRHKFNEKYSGQYSYKINKTGDKVLQDEFFFSFSDSSNYKDSATDEPVDNIVRISKMKYSGQFDNGKKVGQFTEDLLFDDGVDLYSKWTIKIDFENDQCKSGTFIGAIGTAMPPETTYKFENLKTCSFDNVTSLVQKEWSKEFERRKNSR